MRASDIGSPRILLRDVWRKLPGDATVFSLAQTRNEASKKSALDKMHKFDTLMGKLIVGIVVGEGRGRYAA